MTGRLLLPMLLLVAAVVCAETAEDSILWRKLSKRGIKLVEAPASSSGSEDDGWVKSAKTAILRATGASKELKATTAASTKAAHLPHKSTKDKKEAVKNRVPSHTTKLPFGTKTAHKDRTPGTSSKIGNDNAAAPQSKGTKNSTRQHKAVFVNYPSAQRVYQDKPSKALSSSKNRKKQKQKQKPSKRKQQQQQQQDSDIFFIRLPPTPYSYVPGLGYISQPPSFSAASLAAAAGSRPPAPPPPPPQKQQQHHKPRPQKNPFIKVPIEFVSNGKPTSVYRWPQQQPQQPAKDQHHYNHNHHKLDSPIIRLNRGPYYFNGRPESIYSMKRNPRPAIPNLY